MSLPEALERAASDLQEEADAIRPANGDPDRLLETLAPQAAARVLGWLLVHEPEAGDELATAWAERTEDAAPFAGVEEGALPKAGRKVLRRALHRLRSRGVETPQPEREERVATLPRVEEALEAAYVTALDPAGARLVYLIEPHPAGGARLFELVVDEERGVLDGDAYTANRSGARRLMRELPARERFPAVEAPPGAVRALLARVVRAQAPDRPPPRAFTEHRPRLTAPPPDATPPGALVREALGAEEAEPGRVREAVELVRSGKVGPWPPSTEALRAMGERVREAASSRVAVSDAQRQEQVAGVIDEALAEVFDAAAAARAADRFEEQAFVLWKTGQEEDARACVAAAREVREDPPAQSPVLRELIERALAPVLESLREEDKEHEESSPLVKP